MRPAQQLSQNHAGLRVAVVVRLQSRKDQVKVLVLNRSRECLGGIEGIQPDKGVVFQMNGTVSALGQRLAEYLGGTGRSRRDYNHFAPVLFFLTQGFFERVRIGLIDLVGNVLPNPGAALVEFERSVLLRDLLHADQDFHKMTPAHLVSSAGWEQTGEYK